MKLDFIEAERIRVERQAKEREERRLRDIAAQEEAKKKLEL